MPIKLEDKKAIVADVNKVANAAVFAIIANYRGLTVAEMTELRNKARMAGIYLRVVRNTLALRAVKGTHFACLEEALIGPVILLFTPNEAGDAARLVRDFAKTSKLLTVSALSFGNVLRSGEELDAVAELPTRDQAIALLMSVMQAPVTQFVRTLTETYAQCVRVISAVGDKKQAA